MSKKTRRHDRILTLLEDNPSIRVNEIADDLDVSTETVRRDLSELDDTGQIKRTYGGAVRTKTFEPALAERSTQYITARKKIAQMAVEHVGNSNSLFIGGGATTLHFARALRETSRRLTVLTPSFSVATELATNPAIEVMALPGIVEPNEGMAYGGETLKYIAQFRTKLAVVGASGVDPNGVSEALLNIAPVYSAMIRNADETVVLADASKFGTRSLQQTIGMQSNLCLITDRPPDPSIRDAIQHCGARLICGAMDDET
jgi:DeoR/GlpR family transcriptional regulator of sugar metabolism|tara:strand:- start:528 stop:1304 length:777 start_codon:yes stop_codon:yes gene_type:complete